MNISIHSRIRRLIEETSDAYRSYDTQADFAEFAAMAIAEFKSVLCQPDLTTERLAKILRRGVERHRDKDAGSWSAFMAHHIARAANADILPAARSYSLSWQSAGASASQKSA